MAFASSMALHSSTSMIGIPSMAMRTPVATRHDAAPKCLQIRQRVPVVGRVLALRQFSVADHGRRLISISKASRAPAVFPGNFRGAASGRSAFMQGEMGFCIHGLLPPPVAPQQQRKRTGPVAAADDVPAFKGCAPMTEKPEWFWRVLACIPYLMPLSQTWMGAETAYSLFPFLEDFEFATYPFLTSLGSLPGWFPLAYWAIAYLGIVKKNRWPHFLRFHVVFGLLLEVILQVMGQVNDWVPQSVHWGKLGAHSWLAVSMAFFFITIDCIRCALNGMYANVPFLADAAYMQIPYE